MVATNQNMYIELATEQYTEKSYWQFMVVTRLFVYKSSDPRALHRAIRRRRQRCVRDRLVAGTPRKRAPRTRTSSAPTMTARPPPPATPPLPQQIKLDHRTTPTSKDKQDPTFAN